MFFLSWTSQTWLSLSLHLSPSQVEMLSLHKQVQKFTSSLFLLCFLILTSSQTRSFTCSLLFASPLLLLHSFTSCWQTIVCLSSFFFFLIDSPSICLHLFSLSPSGTQHKTFSQVQKFTSPPSTSLIPRFYTCYITYLCSFRECCYAMHVEMHPS